MTQKLKYEIIHHVLTPCVLKLRIKDLISGKKQRHGAFSRRLELGKKKETLFFPYFVSTIKASLLVINT
jgi:hypothetical protein